MGKPKTPSPAQRMHALMIGQPNFGSAAASAGKAGRGPGGRFTAQAPKPADAPAEPRALVDRLKDGDI